MLRDGKLGFVSRKQSAVYILCDFITLMFVRNYIDILYMYFIRVDGNLGFVSRK